MKDNIVRAASLGVLIMLCIWQTITLWLGDMSGHNFFGNITSAYETEVLLYPKQTWANINRTIYKVEGNNDDHDIHYRLLYELFNELKRGDLESETLSKVSYADLLSSTSGIVYEYGVPLTIDEIIGKNIKNATSKYSSIKAKTIYVDMSTGDRRTVYLIDQDMNVRQKVVIRNFLNYHYSVMKHYNEEPENLEDIKIYQASILSPNDSEMFAGNIFYPINNAGMPILYRQVTLKQVVSGPYDEHLVNYVNDLFKNPNNITKTPKEGGMTFSDNLNISVKYNSTGMLEFKRTPTEDGEKCSSAEKIGKIAAYIKESQAIPFSLKKGLYLKEIETDDSTGETYFRFGYQYNNFEVALSEEVKTQLGVKSFLELGIKNSEITSGKWLMYELIADVTTNSNTYEYKKESSEAIDEMAEEMDFTLNEGFILENLECAYIIKSLTEELGFEWIGVYHMIPREIETPVIDEAESILNGQPPLIQDEETTDLQAPVRTEEDNAIEFKADIKSEQEEASDSQSIHKPQEGNTAGPQIVLMPEEINTTGPQTSIKTEDKKDIQNKSETE